MKPEETLDFHIRRVWHSIAKGYNTEAAKYGWSMATGQILLNIDQEEGSPSTSLGPKMGMEPTSLSRTLKTMEERGLICRKPDPTDKRVVRVHLTEQGKEKRLLAREAVIAFNENVQGKLPKKKLSHFFEVMTTINEMLQNEELFTAHETEH